MTTLKLSEGDFRLATSAGQDWMATPADGIDYEMLFSPTFWSNVARQLTVNDVIRVVPKGKAYFAMLLVLDKGPKADQPGAPYARLVELMKVDLNKACQAPVLESADVYKIKDRGEKAGWSVIRKIGGAIVKEGMATEADAKNWLEKNSLKPVAAAA